MCLTRDEEVFDVALTWRWLYGLILAVGCLVFMLSLWDLFFEKGLKQLSFILYLILLILLLFLYGLIGGKQSRQDLVTLFEKTLQGKLYHFKCPRCQGIFAVKESMYNDHNPILLTCPDCGNPGKILPHHQFAVEKIPLKKSKNVLLRCSQCGESLKIWAEGTRLYPYVKVFSCPFCGSQKPLNRI